MKLYLIRHTEAVPMGGRVLRDEDRYIDRGGKKKLLTVIKAWQRLEIQFDHVLCSPVLRARQTAQIIRKKCIFHSKKQILDALVPEGNPVTVLHHISQFSALNSVALVSHNPLMTQLGHLLLGLDQLVFDMRPADLLEIEISSFSMPVKGILRNFIQL